MDWSVWLAFFAASWLISISPGAGAVFAMSNGLAHGFARGYVAVIGLILGIWTLLAVVALGLGAMLATSSDAFNFLKWFGVAYLLYLGWQQFNAPVSAVGLQAEQALHESAQTFNASGMVLKGWAINATNPKGVLFMLAVVPQFIDPSRPLWPQYLFIGLTLAFTDLVVMAGYTLLAAKVLRAFKSTKQVKIVNRLFAGLFVLAAVLLASFKKHAA
jgi:homoserine/homoserine lactone efflux protein